MPLIKKIKYPSANQLSAGTYAGVNGENYSISNISYDKNGNILSMNRSGKNGNAYTLIDQLTYSYSGNRLTNIVDGVSGNNDVGDFRDAGTSTDYTYNVDGSLKSDANKGISQIFYDTYLNRVRQVNFSNGKTMKLYYDASGKLLKRSTSGGDTWQYDNEMTYKNGQAYQIEIPEGRLVNNNGVWEKQFYYQDHLGSNRVTFRANEGRLEKVQVTDYDPWGWELNHSYSGNPTNNFKFQGKEKLDEVGWTNFGARMYDAKIGLFRQIDPYSENHYRISAYNLVLNNPLKYIDPFGLDTLSTKDKKFSWDIVKPGDVVDGSNVLPEVVVKTQKAENRNFEITLFGEWKLLRYQNNYIIQTPWVKDNAAFTPGPFVIASTTLNPKRKTDDRDLIMHEFGHIETLKLLKYNFLLYYSVIALPSVINYITDIGGEHQYLYTEKIANTLIESKYNYRFDDSKNYPTFQIKNK